MATAAVIGSTGLVGGYILSTLLGLDAAKAVHTISRRAPKSEGPKFTALLEVDTDKWTSMLSSVKPVPDMVLSSLGTTRAAAGGIANQWKIDHDLNVELAKTAHAAGVKTFVFVSSTGTRGLVASMMPYSKMKNGVEDAIQKLGFEQAIILKPGLIMGEREVGRTGEGLAQLAVNGLGSLSKGLKDSIGQDAEVIGRAAVKAALLAHEGKAPSKFWVVEPAEIVKLGQKDAVAAETKTAA